MDVNLASRGRACPTSRTMSGRPCVLGEERSSRPVVDRLALARAGVV